MAYNINPLAPYRYKEQNVLVPIQFGAEVTISPEDKIISVTADGSLLGTVALDVDKGVLSLVGKDGQPFSSVEIPTVSGFDDAKFNEETLELTITVELSDGTKKEVVIPFKDMLDGYATVEDVQENTEDIKKNAADIATVNENLVSAIENINNVVLPKIVGDINQSIMNETDARLKADAALDEAIKKNASDVATVNSNLVSSVEVLNKNMADGFNTINGGINNEIRPAISGNTERIVALEESDNKSVKWTDVSTAENPGRKSIILGNHDTILGATTSGGSVNVAMVSKWDKVDLGSAQVEINLNGSADHPTYNDNEELAFLSDVQAANENVATKEDVAEETAAREAADNALSGRVDAVESKVENKVDWTDVSTEENPNRKAVVLGNHDTLLGTTTSGGAVNVAMVSKWDKVDLGSGQVELNLNGSADHPTYNDNEKLAFISDIQAAHENAATKEDVAEEKAAREAADKALSGRVDAVVQSVADEAIARENKDTEIEGKLDSKVDKVSMPSSVVDGIGDIVAESDGVRMHFTELEYNSESGAYGEPVAKEVVFPLASDLDAGLLSADEKRNIPHMINIPIRSLRDQVYPQAEILNDWFHVEDIIGLKNLFVKNKLFLRYGISLSTNPMYYRMPVNYSAFQTANLIQIKFLGLDTRNDEPVVYNIDINLDGTVFEGSNSNVRMSLDRLAYASEIEDGFVSTEEFEALKAMVAGKAEASALEQESTDRKSADDALSGRVDTVESKVEKKVDWTDVSTGENPNRKSIILGNHDTILGTTTSGGSVNVAMVSKWDKVDLGSAQVEINLNGSADHPTYNDNEKLAFISDIQAAHENAATKEDVAEEKAAREAADKALSGRVDAVVQSVADEAIARENKDTEIEGKLAGKADASALEQESADRKSTDEALSGRVDTVESKVKNKVDWTDVSTAENPGRKSIILGNHDTILGATTSGGSVNVAMVSKWDKVDLGSAQVELNLNGSATRPTYNDDQQLALMSDVVSGLDSIELVQRSGETESHIYDLMVNGESVGTINVPFDKFIKSVEYVESSHTLNIVFVTEDGEQPTPVNLSGLVDVYSAGNGLALADGTFSIKIDEASDSYLTLSESGLKLSGVADALALKMDKVNMPSNVVSVLGDVVSEADTLKLQYTGLEYNVRNGAYGEGVSKEVSIPMASQEKAGAMSSADKVKLDSLTPDVYEINITNLLSAEDSESISTAIGGWDNLVAVPSKNQVIVGLLGNGSVSVSLRKVGNTVSLFYIVDAIGMGYTVNEVNITNSSNELSKSVNTHAVLTEDMVIDTLNSDEETLPLSAKQGKVLDEKTRVIAVPIRTGLNKAYTQEEILGWFGVSDIPSLKQLISANCVFVLSYGILLTGNPMYYKIPVNYIAFESANQIKIVAIGLDTNDDKPVRYTILINLDGTLITEKSNISLVMENLVFESDLPVSEVRIDATEILEADDTTIDQSLTDDTLFETLSNAIAVHQDVILYDQDEQVKAISLKHTTATDDGTIDEIIMHYYNGDGFVRVAIKETASETYVFEKDTLTLA